jgi:hypothetical protein
MTDMTTPIAPPAGAADELFGPVQTSILTPSQSREMADELVRHGGATREQADAALAADGIAPLPPDPRTAEQKEFDEMWPKADASQIRPAYFGRTAGADPQTVGQFHAEASAFVLGIDMPAAVANSFLETVLDKTQAQSRMTPGEQALWAQDQRAIFERVAGSPEKAEAKRKLALDALARAPGPFVNSMRAAGAFRSADVLLLLAHQGERLAIRGKR